MTSADCLGAEIFRMSVAVAVKATSFRDEVSKALIAHALQEVLDIEKLNEEVRYDGLSKARAFFALRRPCVCCRPAAPLMGALAVRVCVVPLPEI